MYYCLEDKEDSLLPNFKTICIGEDKQFLPQYDLELSEDIYKKLYEFGFSELMEGVFQIPSSISDAKIEKFFNSLGWNKI